MAATPSQNEEAVVVYLFRDVLDGEDVVEYWLDIRVNGKPYGTIGPFDTALERQRAVDDLLNMTRSLGAIDLPRSAQ